MKKRHRASSEIDALLPALHGAINQSKDAELGGVFFDMLKGSATTREGYLQEIDNAIRQRRQLLAEHLGPQDPRVEAYDQEATILRTRIAQVLRMNGHTPAAPEGKNIT